MINDMLLYSCSPYFWSYLTYSTFSHCRMNVLVLTTVVILLQVSYTKSQCPSTVTNCTCVNTEGSSRKTIRCLGLKSIPAFTSSPEIFQKLDMDSPTNEITMIQANAFNGILVEEIDMSGSKIKLQTIHQMAFTGLEQHLKSVKLQGNERLPPPFDPLKNMTILETLELHYFQLSIIDDTTPFNYFPNLKTLRLRNMGTNFVSRESFKNQLSKLTVFEFSNNNVPTFPAPAIGRLRTLLHLSWLHNGMTSISFESFVSLNNLIELDLRGNEIGQMDSECFKGITEKLEFLSLQLNQLTKNSIVPLGNYAWPKLEQLNLGHMKVDFTEIPNGLFRNMSQLANLMLPGNKLRRIKQNDFQGLRNIHSLDLSENWINTIEEEALSHMPRLDTLDLRNQYDVGDTNPFNFTIGAIKGVELALKTLYIQENHLIELYAWEAISALKKLNNLDISKTGLSDIPPLVFYSHNELGSLAIRGNNVSVLRQESLYGLQYSLKTIDFSNNNIYTIDDCVFKSFNRLNYILGSQNPIKCDCNLHGFHSFLKSLDASSFAYVLCDSPQNLRGSDLKSLTGSALCSNPPTEATCPVFTTTTTTMSTTTSVVPLPDIQFGISSASRTTIVISWLVTGDMTYLQNFLVQYKQLGINDPELKSFQVDRSKRDHAITGLAFGSSYEICFYIKVIYSTPQDVLVKCSIGQTQDIPDPTTPSTVGDSEANTGDDTVKIVGGVLGGFAIIALVVILFFVFITCRRKDTKPPLPPPNGNIIPVGYQSRPTSQPKVFVRKANGEMQVMNISNGKLDTSRISGGSYQNINLNAVSDDPYPTKGATGGGAERDRPNSKQLQVNLPQEQKPGEKTRDPDRYTKMPNTNNGIIHYVNEPQRRHEPEHYTNAVEARPLPQTPHTNPLSSSGGGFLNHGFTSSPTDNEYYEIDSCSGTVV